MIFNTLQKMKQWTFFVHSMYTMLAIIATMHQITICRYISSQEQHRTFESAVKLWTSSHH